MLRKYLISGLANPGLASGPKARHFLIVVANRIQNTIELHMDADQAEFAVPAGSKVEVTRRVVDDHGSGLTANQDIGFLTFTAGDSEKLVGVTSIPVIEFIGETSVLPPVNQIAMHLDRVENMPRTAEKVEEPVTHEATTPPPPFPWDDQTTLSIPTTEEGTTTFPWDEPTTPEPTTLQLTTPEPTTPEPTTPEPTTPEPTTPEPTTPEPTTPEPTTAAPPEAGAADITDIL